ncbi:MAG: hypothetical protein U0Z44_14600 [Kouleothrix sp.]
MTLLAGGADAASLPPAYAAWRGRVSDDRRGSDGLLAGQPSIARAGEQCEQARQRAAAVPIAQRRAHPRRLAGPIRSCAALPAAQLPALAEAIRAVKYRWERGFASVLLEGPLICGVGACNVCATKLRNGTRMLCSDGPVFDMRDLPA